MSLKARYTNVWALRDSSRKLTVIDYMLARGAWLRQNSGAPLNEFEVGVINGKRIAIRRMISGLMPSLRTLYASRRLNGTQWSKRILGIAREFVVSPDRGLTPSTYRECLSTNYLSGDLRCSELTLAAPAIQLACLHEIYGCLERAARNGPTSEAGLFGRFVELAVFFEGPHGDDCFADLFPFERILVQDPAHFYALQSTHTKSAYRLAVAEIAELCNREESCVAQIALEMAVAESRHHENNAREQSHIGFYLIDAGKASLLERLCESKPSSKGKRDVRISTASMPIPAYLSLAVAMWMAFITLSLHAYMINVDGVLVTSIAAVCLIVISSDSANRLLDKLLWFKARQRQLPYCDYSLRIPDSSVVLVCIPSMLYSSSNSNCLVASLEEHYLRTLDRNIFFALLTDFVDSDSCDANPLELEALADCQHGIRRLNERYGDSEVGPFYMLHRERRFSQSENTWMGWERKRGKLELLNKFILYGENGFDRIEGDSRFLRHVKYVVVVDDNSHFPRGAVQKLVGLIDHPLNRAELNVRGELDRGYGMFQPHTCVAAGGAFRWRTMRPLLGPACDPTNSPQRNFYFDLFASCSFFGKGVYNVKAFDAVVGNRIPTESVLSHDTLEAGLLRTGFAGDVAFSEQPPLNLKSYLERQHRWARGDWQNVFLIYGPFKKALALRRFGEISPLIKYLLLIFARRSLLPIARAVLLLCIALSLQFLFSKRLLLCVSLWLIPDAIEILLAFIAMTVIGQVIYHRRLLLSRLATALKMEFLLSVLALHQALLLGDAIVRTFQRFCRGKKLLSWRAASFSESQPEATGLVEVYAAMSVFISAAASGFIFWNAEASVWSLLVTLTWFLYGGLFIMMRVFSGSSRAAMKADRR